MCGISGFFNPSALNFDSKYKLSAMAQALSRRGPDGSGCWVSACKVVGFSHTRLAVVDLSSAGKQPMHSHCSRYTLVFNGEIYNHKELRAKLNASVEWAGQSDSEVLLALISHYGVEHALQCVVGMFALALWDAKLERLVIARDRLGEKPVYWGLIDGVFVFASDLAAINAFSNGTLSINKSSLQLYFQFHYIPSPHCIYEGVFKLGAGEYIEITKHTKLDNIEPQAYWSLFDKVNAAPLCDDYDSPLRVASELERLITDSVRGQMLADVSVGAFLSGGIDSSLVAALMQQESAGKIQTFAIGFDEAGYNEAPFAKEIARQLGTEHHELYFGAGDALDLVPKLSQIYTEPFADSSQLPSVMLSSFARSQVTVALTGDGGDELFGGYNTYQLVPRIWRCLSRMPLPLRKKISEMLSVTPLPGKLFKLSHLIRASSPEELYHLTINHWSGLPPLVKGFEEVSTIFTETRSSARVGLEEWMMAVDAKQYMTDDVLVKVDRAAMYYGLETRAPLLDHRVVEYALGIPSKLKIRAGVSKWILRQVLYRHVPRRLIERPKRGFSAPVGSWLRGPLREWAEDLLSPERLENGECLDVSLCRELWSQHLHKRRDHSKRLWAILMFQSWLESK